MTGIRFSKENFRLLKREQSDKAGKVGLYPPGQNLGLRKG